MLPLGLSRLIRDIVGDPDSTHAQDRAIRYLVNDMPPSAGVDGELAHQLLCVRSYVVGLLASLDRKGVAPHPREAMALVLAELLDRPEKMRAITQWSRQRYLEERGPARVGATRYADELGDLASRASRPRPSPEECRRTRDQHLRVRGLGPLIDHPRVRIVYDSGEGPLPREISEIEFHFDWPDWAAYLIDPSTFATISAYCHLRKDFRTFNLMRISSVSPA